MTLRIVPTAAVTFEVWRDLWLDYVGGQIAADSPLHRHTYEHLCAADALHGRMAMEGDAALGFVHYYFHPSTWAMTEPCHVQDLYVAPDARGRQLGGRLMEEVRAHAQAMGSQVVHWNTRAGNDPARALYDRIATLSDRVIYLLSVAPAD